jgi:hypothetical protein
LVLAPKTDAISLATFFFGNTDLHFPVDLRVQIRNLEVGMEMKSSVMNGEQKVGISMEQGTGRRT